MKFASLLVGLSAASTAFGSSIKLYKSPNYIDKCGEISAGWVSGHEYHNVPADCRGKVQSFQVYVSAVDHGVRLWSGLHDGNACGGSAAGYTTEDWSRPSISSTWNRKIECIEFIG